MNSIKYIVGEKNLETKPLIFFNPLACDFLSELSQSLIKDKFARKFPDIISFAFWCREANLKIIKNQLNNKELRVGLGLIFHITPSNVPVNFAFSFAFGLLTGNANLVKLPSKEFSQIKIICGKISHILNKKKFKSIKKMNCFFKYDSKNELLTKEFSSRADGRMIWGGDQTIKQVKRYETKNKVIDITFGDKYSFCAIDSNSINKISSSGIKKLIENFYNDTYVMDQNACSSPHLIIWVGSTLSTKKAKNKFWSELLKYIKKKYIIDEINVIDKYEKLCSDAIEIKNIGKFKTSENLIHRIDLKKLPENIVKLKGKFGYFYEYNTKNIDKCAGLVNSKFQTLTYYGINHNKLSNFILSNRLEGIDRIVPIGKALDIGFIWDGYNLDKFLTRVIEIK